METMPLEVFVRLYPDPASKAIIRATTTKGRDLTLNNAKEASLPTVLQGGIFRFFAMHERWLLT